MIITAPCIQSPRASYMTNHFARLAEEARSLAQAEKTALARVLIEDLDETHDPDAESTWRQEVAQRVAEYRAGRTAALPGPESIARIRERRA